MPGGMYTLVIKKGDTETRDLGIRVAHADGSTLLVNIILAWGLIAEWNAKNPHRQMMVYDVIIEVNGIRGNAQEMLNEIRTNRALEFLVCRMSAEELMEIRREPFQGHGRAPKVLVDRLPSVRASTYGVTECAICRADFAPDGAAVRLPCGHSAFCSPCIREWLLRYKDECPLCLAPVGSSSSSFSSARDVATAGGPAVTALIHEDRCRRCPSYTL